MDRLFALLCFTLSLFGIDTGTATLLQRSPHDAADMFVSRTTVKSGITRFDCVRSTTGRCHYTVLPPRCIGSTAATLRCPRTQFALPKGHSRRVSGMARFRLCVSSQAGLPTTRCELPERQ